MRPNSPSSHHDSRSPSETEDYPVWRRWGDLDKHGRGEVEARIREHIEATARQADSRPPSTESTPPQPVRPVKPEITEASTDAAATSGEGGPVKTEADELVEEFSALDIQDRVVIMLLFKQIVQIEDVEAAWRRFKKKDQGRNLEPLWRELARDPRLDRNRIFAEAAITAGYEEARVDPSEVNEFLNSYFHTFSESDWERMLELSVMPVARDFDPKSKRERFVFISPDPTRHGVSKLMRDLKLDAFVLRYARKSLVDSLLADVIGRGVSPSPFGARQEPGDSLPEVRATPPSIPFADEEWAKDLRWDIIEPIPAGDLPPMIDEYEAGEVDEEVDAPQSGPMEKIESIIRNQVLYSEAAARGPKIEPDAEESIERRPDIQAEEAPPVEPPGQVTPGRALFEELLAEAVRIGASGVHLQPVESGLQIDMRVRGELQFWRSCSRALGDELAAAVKASALNIRLSESDTVQEGIIRRQVGDSPVQFRVSILPVAGGWNNDRRESIVLSSIGEDSSQADLSALGLPEEVLRHIRDSITELRGMIIVAGPSGSGRSQTLSGILNQVITPKLNVITLEDAVSVPSAGILQVRLGQKLDHEDALEAVRRHDPDVILAGELRTRETAELALKLANTGPLVLARMPVHDTSGVIVRLFRMGVDPFLTGYAIRLIVAQRLVRRLCEECRRPATHIDGELLHRLGFTRGEIASTTFFEEGQAASCGTCGGRRYSGTRVVAEAMPLTHDLRRLIALADKSFDEEELRVQAIREGMTTLRAAAREFVKQGEMSIDELIRTTAGN